MSSSFVGSDTELEYLVATIEVLDPNADRLCRRRQARPRRLHIDASAQGFEHASVLIPVTKNPPGVRGDALQPAQHLGGVGMAARRVSRVDEVERFRPVGNPAPHEPTRSRVAKQPGRRIVVRHARADPQCVLGHRLSVLRREQSLRAGRGIEQVLDDKDRRVFGRPWRRPEVKPGGHLPTVSRSRQRPLMPRSARSHADANGWHGSIRVTAGAIC